jgi:quercetin dioxygenase-like cupin family protein
MENIFNHSQVFDLSDSVEYSSGAIVSKVITKNATGNLTLFAFDADQGLSEHSAPFNALIQVIDGEGEIRIAGKPYLVKKGEFIIMPANVPHSVHAPARFKMFLIMIKG